MNERVQAIVSKLIKNILDVCQEYQVTEGELLKAIDFLTRIGQHDQFHLLSDLLGISVAVDDITYKSTYKGATENNVEGPMYRPGAPLMNSPGHLCPYYHSGEPLFLSGRVLSAEDGRPIPRAYEIGKVGPIRELRDAMGWHGWRPAHIHFKVSAENHRPVTTQLYFEGDPWLDSDAIGAVKKSLVLKLTKHEDPKEWQEKGVNRAFYTTSYDFVLVPSK